MNKAFLLIILIVITCCSCRLPYNPDVEAGNKILVVDALLTNHAGASYVRLSMAIPYDVTGISPCVMNATVFLTDETNNSISFSETSPGYYEPVDTEFEGKIHVAYKLSVITPDGSVYVSAPETIPEDIEPVNVYGGYTQTEYLIKVENGKTIRQTGKFCALYFDYIGVDVVPRFRYTSSRLIEYGISIASGTFYCWKTVHDNNLRFTNEKFASSSINIHKQEVSISPYTNQILVRYIIDSPLGWIYSDSLIMVPEYRRIVTVDQYRLNDDSYAYYKSLIAQSEAEGKMFDPVISQVVRNISCVNDPDQPVLGFFEASNLMTVTYDFRRYGVGSDIFVTRIDNLPPHSPEGFLFNHLPDFWIQ